MKSKEQDYFELTHGLRIDFYESKSRRPMC